MFRLVGDRSFILETCNNNCQGVLGASIDTMCRPLALAALPPFPFKAPTARVSAD